MHWQTIGPVALAAIPLGLLSAGLTNPCNWAMGYGAHVSRHQKAHIQKRLHSYPANLIRLDKAASLSAYSLA